MDYLFGASAYENTEQCERFYAIDTWTQPLRTDVPSQYQVSIADHDIISQANYDESVQLGGSSADYPLNLSKAMMFEDLVLQSITYENETLKLTVPDILPQSQEWSISVSYWDIQKAYSFKHSLSSVLLDC